MIRRTAGEHQIKKDVNLALASGFGGTIWTVLVLLSRHAPQIAPQKMEV